MVALQNYAVIVAHPDDEILFSSGLLKSAKKIIICFQGVPNNKELSESRKRLVGLYPLKNVIFLNIEQGRKTKEKVNWKNPTYTKFGIRGKRNEEELNFKFNEIAINLKKYLKDIDEVFTHNPWGDYGHVDHILIFNAVKHIKKKLKFKINVFGVFSSRTHYLLRQNLKYFKSKPLKVNSDEELFFRLKKFYIENNCWTWDKDYHLNKFEYYYLFHDSSNYSTNLSEYSFNFIYSKPFTLLFNKCKSVSINSMRFKYFFLINSYFYKVTFIFNKIKKIYLKIINY